MANNLLQMSIGRAHDNIDSLMLNGYKGTLPLTMEMFPEKRWSDDQGRQWTSNIKTRLEKDNGKWYLFPTMMGGLDLPEAGAYRGALKGKHFGVYDSYDEGMKADRVIHNHFEKIKGYQNGGTVKPISTNVHNRIDDLILKADLDRFDQTGFMYADKTPAYIGGADPVVENIAMGPLLTLKSMGSVGRKLLEKTGLRNPVTHYTTGSGATEILKSGAIRGRDQAFPGKPFKRDSRKAIDAKIKELEEKTLSSADELQFYADELIPGSPAVSVTRDPMFLSRPHAHVGSDIGLIMDRDQLRKQGMKILPFTERGYGKLYTPETNWRFPNVSKVFYKGQQKSEDWLLKKQIELTRQGKDWLKELNKTGLRVEYLGKKFNPKFEFEERIRGYVPTKNVSLIDLTRLPPEQSNIDIERFKTLFELAKSKKPIIKSFEAKEGLQKTLNMLNNISRLRLGKGKPFSQYFKEQGIDTPDYIQATEQLLDTPTYRFQPFSKVQ